MNFGSQLTSSKLDVAVADSEKSIYTKSLPDIITPPEIISSKAKPYINAHNYILVDQKSNETLIALNEHQQVPIASTTKIMTATVALENYKLDDVITISATAANQIGSDSHLIAGEQMTVEGLLNCLLIPSGNDAAYALAEHYTGGVTAFVKAMNDKAESLNMRNTHYLDPAGLEATAYSSAYDLSIIARLAMKNSTFSKIVSTSEITINDITGKRHHDLKNSNHLVTDMPYSGILGIKTGFIPEAGHCLVAAAQRDNTKLFAVILNTGSNTITASAIEARKLLDYGYSNFNFE